MKIVLKSLAALSLLLACELAQPEDKKKTEEEDSGATDEEGDAEGTYTVEDTADFMLVRLVGDNEREGRDERSLVLANKLYGIQIGSKSEAAASSAAEGESTDSGASDPQQGEETEDCIHTVGFDGETEVEHTSCGGGNDGSQGQSEPGSAGACSFTIDEEGKAVEDCPDQPDVEPAPGEPTPPKDWVVEKCLNWIDENEDVSPPLPPTEEGGDVAALRVTKEGTDCYEYIPIDYDAGYCGYESDPGMDFDDQAYEVPAQDQESPNSNDTEATSDDDATESGLVSAALLKKAPPPPEMINPIGMPACAEPVANQVSEGKKGSAILRELLIVIISLFDVDGSGKLSKDERQEAVTVIIKAVFN